MIDPGSESQIDGTGHGRAAQRWVADASERSAAQRNTLGPQRQPKLVAEQFVLRAAARVRLSVLQNLPHAFAARLQEHLSRALAAEPRQEADQELVSGEGAVEHGVESDGAGEPTGAVELQPVGEQKETDLRARDGVVCGGQRR